MSVHLVRVLPARLKEIDFQRQLVGTKPPGLAVILGWDHVHFRPAMTKYGYRTAGSGSMAAGWPDLVLVRGPRLIFAELKRDGAKPSDEQARVLEILHGLIDYRPDGTSAIEVVVWHPSDWPTIEATLR